MSTRVKIDGKVKEVLGCAICQSELKYTKKVKVLYFLIDGNPVHWSEVKEYVPQEHFWSLNMRSHVRRPSPLEVVRNGEGE